MVKILTYCFDLDLTLCLTSGLDYNRAVPIQERINVVNELYRLGHEIKIYTARGTETGISWEEVTKNQLKLWRLKYHGVYFGKPSADFYIDDKGVKDSDFFRDLLH